MASTPLKAQVTGVRLEATDIISIELQPAAGSPAFQQAEAGAHIDLHLGSGVVRSYSLINPGESGRYVIAVKKDRNSRGGSRYVHEQLRVGQVIDIGNPRNHFGLCEHAPHTVLLAGGIGVTPIYAMLQRLRQLGMSAHVIYCTRSRAEAAFVQQIEKLVLDSPGRLTAHFHFSDEQVSHSSLALPAVLAGQREDAHFYCCGPASMLDDFEDACTKLGRKHVHLERFGAAPKPEQSPGTGYSAHCKRSGITVRVQPGASLLEAMLQAGVNVDYSCREGVCGACETRVLLGEIDHRDHILGDEERTAGQSMMVCVSGCKSETLVLDA